MSASFCGADERADVDGFRVRLEFDRSIAGQLVDERVDLPGAPHDTPQRAESVTSLNVGSSPVAFAPEQHAAATGETFTVTHGSALGYSTYFGGTGDDYAAAVAVDSAGSAYLLGNTDSDNLIVTPGVYQPRYNGQFGECCLVGNAFIAKFAFSNATLTSTQVSTSSSSEPSGTAVTFTATVAPVSGTWTPTGDVSFRIDGAPYIHVTLDSSGHASYSTDTLTAGQHTITAAYLGTPHYDLAPDGYGPSSASLVETITAE